MKNRATAWLLHLALGLMATGLFSVCSADPIYKCIVNGSTIYQSEPCKGAGTAIKVDPGPSADQIREAQYRAGNAYQAAMQAKFQREQHAMQEQYAAAAERKPAQPDCAALNQKVADAYGQRNGNQKAMKDVGIESGELQKIDEKNTAAINKNLNASMQAANQAGCHP